MRLAAYDGSIPEAYRMLPPALAAHSLAAARLSLPRIDRSVRVETIGTPPRRPRLSLVVAAGAPDFIRARSALLSCEPEAERVEIVYHARAGEAAAVRRALEGVHAVFGLACRMVTSPEDANSAERLRAALCASLGPALVLGGQAMPAEAGWLATWTKALRGARAPLILGGTLLGPDGSIAEAGAWLRVRNGAALIQRRWVGLPASALPAHASGGVDIVGAECVGLSRAAVAAFCASGRGHPSAEVRLFDIARRFRRGRVLVQGRFIRFGEGCAPDMLGEAADAQAMAELRLGIEGRA
jgi:hypothetical protein